MARLGRRFPVKPHYNSIPDVYGKVAATKFTTSAVPAGFSFKISYNRVNNCIYGGAYGSGVGANIYKIDSAGAVTTHGSLAYVQSCSVNQYTGEVYYGRDISTSQKITTGNTISQFAAQTANGANHITYNSVRDLVFENAYWANTVYIFNTSGGTVTSAAITRPTNHVVDTAGNVFVSASTTSAIYKIDTSNVSTLAYSPGGNIGAMVFDSDGNMFALDVTNNLVKKITPGGTITTFATMSAGMQDMTIDELNNLYVTNNTNGTITQITPGGVASLYVTGISQIVFVIYNADTIYFTENATFNIYSAPTPVKVKIKPRLNSKTNFSLRRASFY